MLLIPDAEWLEQIVPAFLELRAGIADAEMRLLVAVRDVCPLATVHGELDGDARMSSLTSSHHIQGDSVSGFVTGFERLQLAAERHTGTYDDLCRASVRRGGHSARRTHNETYLSEEGCGVHNDNTEDHEVVVEMYAGAVCAIEDEAVRLQVIT